METWSVNESIVNVPSPRHPGIKSIREKKIMKTSIRIHMYL